MDRTTVTLVTEDGLKDMGADVLDKSDKRITVIIDGSEESMVLTKATKEKVMYTGQKFGMEFETTGN